MDTISKKKIAIILIGVVVYALIFAVLVYAIDYSHNVSSQISPEWLSIWRGVGIIYSLYVLTTPWGKRIRIISLIQLCQTNLQIWSVLLLFCFVPLIAPILVGLVLFFMGMSISEFYFFDGASVLAGLIWGIYNLRNRQEISPN